MAGAPGQESRNRSMPDNKYGKLFANHALYDYLLTHSYRPNVHLDELHQVTMKHRRAGMCSPPDSIPLLQLLVHLVNAKKIVEVGVFTGYTSLGMALALPEGGRIYACDISDEYPAVGRPSWKAAGVEDKIDLRIAPASETMDSFLQNGEEETFDMGFIDADKSGYDTYYEQLLKLLRPGGVIVVDNTLWDGSVTDPERQDPDTVAIRAINDKIFKDDRVTMCMLPVSDGVTIALKK
ncbi:g10469 [Coccomyxa elongata]